MKLIWVITFAIALTGCASQATQKSSSHILKSLPKKDFSAYTAKINEARTPEQISAATQEKASAEEKDIQDLLTDAYKSCGEVMGGLANDAKDGEQQAFWLQMSGLVLGSVLGPAATAANPVKYRALISASSGWAGATNLAGQSLRTAGLAGDAAAQTRNQIAGAFKLAITEALDGSKSYEDRRRAVLRAKGECVWFAVNVPGAMPSLPSTGGNGSQ